MIEAADDAPAQEALLVRLGLVPAALFLACFTCPAVPWLAQLMARESREGNAQEGTGNLKIDLTQAH